MYGMRDVITTDPLNQAVVRWLLAAGIRVRFIASAGRIFLVHRVALGQVFLRVLRFSVLSIVPRTLK
jgi:hypothetical protein